MQFSRAIALLILATLFLVATPVESHQLRSPGITTPSAGLNSSPILFLLSAFPTSMSIVQGYSGWSTIDVSTFPGQVGSVSLSASASAGLAATLNPTNVSLPPSPATVILSITVNASTTPGSYAVIVTGTNSGFQRAVAVSVIVLPAAASSFALSSGPESSSIQAGTNTTEAVVVTSLNGFVGHVQLSSTVSPAGPNASITPADIPVPSDATVYSTMLISTTPNTPNGNYTVLVKGTNGTLTDSWATEIFVNTKPLDFGISGPTSLTIPGGTNGTAMVTLNGLNGFAGAVKLSATVSPAGPNASISPATITVPSTGQSLTSTLKIATNSSTPPGSYLIKVEATSGTLSHYSSLILTIILGAPPSFSISTNPSSIVLQTGTPGSSNVTLTSLNGFAGNVTLSVVIIIPNTNAPTVSFSPTSVGLSADQGVNSTLNVTPTSSTASGGYTVLLQASGGGVSDSWVLQVFVATTALDFSASAIPATLTIAPGDSTKSTVVLTSLSAFSGRVDLSACVSCFSSPVPGRPIPTLSLGRITLNPSGRANATLTLSTNSTTPIGTYDVVVSTQSGGVHHFLPILVTVSPPPDFSLTANSSDVSFPSGSTGSNSLLVNAFNGFTGTISFTSSSNLAVGVSTSCASVTLTSSTTSQASICSLASSTPGSYLVVVTGTGGKSSMSHHAIIFVTVNPVTTLDFTLSLSATSLTIRQDQHARVTVSLTSLGFSGPLHLHVTISPMVHEGVRARLENLIQLSAGGSSHTVLIISADDDTPTGTYNITITASGGSIIHSVHLTLMVVRGQNALHVLSPLEFDDLD